MGLVWEHISAEVQSSVCWAEARDCVQRYIDAHKIQHTGFWLYDVERDYLIPLLRTYFEEVGALVYHRQRARKAVSMMLRHLDSSEVEVRGLIILEGFQAEGSFRLEPKLLVRPIQETELLELGRADTLVGPGLGSGEHLPHTDWWVCESRLPNPRGTALGWNKVRDIAETLALAFRAFKPGGIRIGSAITQLTSPFGSRVEVRGGSLQQITVGGSRYLLSKQETPKFTAFWRKFRRLMEEPQHYLQIPIRRLRAAGTRAQREDALVDYVIGLEALLGTEDERTELGYRFRVRGSVLLANRKSERKGHLIVLRELYDLRSRIVHGQGVLSEDLEKALPLAESALRRVWNWYFTHWYSETRNRKAIAWVDADLVG